MITAFLTPMQEMALVATLFLLATGWSAAILGGILQVRRTP